MLSVMRNHLGVNVKTSA
ncbi:hypothetical protein V2J09_024237 [Rumex salicifolius]